MDEDIKKWIDGASYEDLLRRWRYEPIGSPYFAGEMGNYYSQKMRERKAALLPGEAAYASKNIERS